MKIQRILRILTACAALGIWPAVTASAQDRVPLSDSADATFASAEGDYAQWGPRDFRQQRRMRSPGARTSSDSAADGAESASSLNESDVRDVSASPSNSSRPASGSGQVLYEDHLIRVSKQRTDTGIISIGSEVSHEITVLAKQPVANVAVEELYPDEVRFVSSEPAGQQNGSNVNWDLGKIGEGESKTILVRSTVHERGTFSVCSVVTADPMICLPFHVGQPVLEIVKSGPPVVELNETADWSIIVTNTGDAPAQDVRIIDAVPESFTAGTEVSFDVGTLEPGESREVAVGASAGEVGSFINEATAEFAGGEPIMATAPIRVVESKVSIEKTGPETSYALLYERFTITATNTGDTDLTNVQVVDRLPQHIRVENAGGGTVVNGSDGEAATITWNVGDLESGASRSFEIVMTSTRPGTTVNTAIVTTDRGLREEAVQQTEWIAVPAVQTSIVDNVDPIRAGQPVVYTLRVWNQSQLQAIENASVQVKFPEQIRALVVKAGSLESDVSGDTVNVSNINLKPGEDIIFTIEAEGAASGFGTVIMETSTGFRDAAVIDQESTTVY